MGKFPEYPDEDDGGSASIFKEKNPEELEQELKEKVSFVCLKNGSPKVISNSFL